MSYIFFFNDTATTEIYTLSLHDALPICRDGTSRLYTLPLDDIDPSAKRLWQVVRDQFASSPAASDDGRRRSEEHTSELQSRLHLVCRLLREKKKNDQTVTIRSSDVTYRC